MAKALFRRLVFTAACCAVIIAAAGGIAFLRRPMGAPYLVLSAVWWLLALLRQRGVPSTYDRKQRLFVTALASALVPFLVVAPPWEYAHLVGPIPRDGPLARAGLVLFASGVTLQAVAMWALGGFYTVRLGMQPGHRLITTGPYRLVRHPGYLSYIMSIMGIGLALSSLIALGLAVLVVPFLLWRTKLEEEMLVAEFGKEYQTYMKQTKWRLVPLIY